MAKYSGPSVIPGAQPVIPTEGKVSDFAKILATPVPEQPTTQELTEAPVTSPANIPTQPIAEVGGGAPMAVEDTSTVPTAPAEGAGVEVGEKPALNTIAETLAAEQRERERVKPFTEKLNVTSLSPASFKIDMPVRQALERAENTSNVLNSDLAASLTLAESETIGTAPEATLSRIDKTTGEVIFPSTPLTKGSTVNLTAKGIFFDPRVLDAGKYNEQTGRTGVDPDFAKVLSLTTEAYLHNQMYNNEEIAPDADADVFSQTDTADPQVPGIPTTRISKAKGRERLGREIYQAWKRQQATNQGRPSDEYLKDIDSIPSDTFTFLGDLAKEVYARANPDILVRDTSEVEEGDGQVYFQLTAEGALELNRLEESFKGLFAQPEVPPLVAASETGQPVNEGRTRVRKVTTKVGDMGDTSVLEESIKNYNKVAFINDPARESATMLIGLLGLLNVKNPENQAYSDMLEIGDKAIRQAENEKARLANAAQREKNPDKAAELMRKANAYDPLKVVQAEREKSVNILAGIARYSGKENHLTFSIQALTGRTHAQQTIYNPQSHKIVRGVIGSGNVFKWEAGKGGALENSWKEIIGTRLFKREGVSKTETLTEAERIKVFNENQQNQTAAYTQAVAWGNELINATKSFDVNGAKEIFIRLRNAKTPEEANAIKQEMLKRFSNDPLSANLKVELAKHGKEFGFFAGYYMDLAKYDTAIKSNTSAGRQFSSSIIAEMDGKTHGPATNAALLGIPEMAKRGGLIRTQDLTVADEIDLRLAMKDHMQETVSLHAGGLYSQEHAAEFKEILNLAIEDRENFLKKSPMTMGYGQELESLKMHVETTVFTGPNGDAIRTVANKINLDPDEVISFLHTMLVDSIFNVFDAKVVASGRLLKANAFLSTITNEVLYFNNAMGFKSYAAGKQMVPELTKQEQFSWRPKEGETRGKKVSVELYREQAEGSAVRPEYGPGGYTSGRIQPVAVQSYDGNMIARTGSNQAFNKIAASVPQGGAPFVLPIFDAFVVDLGSLNTVRQESNKHWYNGIANHSYADEIFTNWYNQTTEAVQKKLGGINKDVKVNWKAAREGQGPFRGLAFQFELAKDSDKLNLRNAIKRVMSFRAKDPGESTEDYTNAQKYQATVLMNKAIKEISNLGIDLSADTLTNGEVLSIIKVLTKAIDLTSRNATAAKVIAKDKQEMLSMVRKEPRNVDL